MFFNYYYSAKEKGKRVAEKSFIIYILIYVKHFKLHLLVHGVTLCFTFADDDDGSCLFAAGLPTDTFGSQSLQTFSTRQAPHLGD